MTGRFIIGQFYDFDFAPASRVVGTDQYTLYSYAGTRKHWTSYTLESDAGGDYARWWLSDEATGLYCWLAADAALQGGTLILPESGLCKLVSAGDSTIETPYSAVLFYQDGDDFSCAEIFEGDRPPFYMRGRKVIYE